MSGDERFTNRRLLASGGMANVYRAFDQRLGQEVALKEIYVSPSLSDRARSQMVARLRREAKTLSRLDHKNIVKCFGLVEERNNLYLVTEFLDGTTLEQEIKSGRIVGDRKKILAVVTQVCSGLEYARRKGVVHRDIKPGNIFICSSGLVKIIDFGIARAEDSESITVDGQILGTPHFMSPEQAAGEKNIDFRSDVFSLGTCIFLAACGSVPFDGNNRFEVEKAVRFAPLPVGKVWPELETVLLVAMSKSPEQRFKSFSEFSAALEGALGEGNRAVPVAPQEERARKNAAPSQLSSTASRRDDPGGLRFRIPRGQQVKRTVAKTPDESRRLIVPAAVVGPVVAVVFFLLLLGLGWLALVVAILGVVGVLAIRFPARSSANGRRPPQAVERALLPVKLPGSSPRKASHDCDPGRSAQPREYRLRYTLSGRPEVSKPSAIPRFEIGRDGGCHIRVPGDRHVSSHHATVSVSSDGSMRIADHSLNGTFIRGRRIDGPTMVPFGVPVRVGTTDIVFDALFTSVPENKHPS